jgi:hypothetical protein
MPTILTITNHAYVIELENMVENLAQPSLDEIAKFRNFESSIQMASAQGCYSLLSLPHLHVKRIDGREPSVNYSQSHVVTSKVYLRIMRQKGNGHGGSITYPKKRKERKIREASKKNTYSGLHLK